MRFCFALLLVSLIYLNLPPAAAAESSRDRTQVGHNITVGPDETIGEATCFGCSVRVRGQVDGDVTTFGGGVVIEEGGKIGGDTTTFGGDIRLDHDVRIGGDVTVFGGRIRRDPSASIGGDITNFGNPAWVLLIVAIPLLLIGAVIALAIWLVRRLLRVSLPARA